MATIEKSEVFFEKLKLRLKSLGLGDSVAHSIANQVVPVKFDGQTVIADCKSQFHGNLIISAKMNDIIEVAKDVWGPNIEFYIRSDSDSITPQPKRSKTSKTSETPSLFDTPEDN